MGIQVRIVRIYCVARAAEALIFGMTYPNRRASLPIQGNANGSSKAPQKDDHDRDQ
jgi:hypothetical protein